MLSNIVRLLSDNTRPNRPSLLYNHQQMRILCPMNPKNVRAMKHFLVPLGLVLALTATQASAACSVNYKAKRDNPLRLEYGTTSVPDSACTAAAAQPIVAEQLAQRGWTLLSIVSVSSGG